MRDFLSDASPRFGFQVSTRVLSSDPRRQPGVKQAHTWLTGSLKAFPAQTRAAGTLFDSPLWA